jgi:hypothetical protein
MRFLILGCVLLTAMTDLLVIKLLYFLLLGPLALPTWRMVKQVDAILSKGLTPEQVSAILSVLLTPEQVSAILSKGSLESMSTRSV